MAAAIACFGFPWMRSARRSSKGLTSSRSQDKRG
jgi:hypothetical protein